MDWAILGWFVTGPARSPLRRIERPVVGPEFLANHRGISAYRRSRTRVVYRPGDRLEEVGFCRAPARSGAGIGADRVAAAGVDHRRAALGRELIARLLASRHQLLRIVPARFRAASQRQLLPGASASVGVRSTALCHALGNHLAARLHHIELNEPAGDP